MHEAGKTVLVVDDEESLRLAIEAIRVRGGYAPISASSAVEALDRSRDFEGEIHLLLTDVVMPGMDGLTLAKHVAAERPRIRVLIMSAYRGPWNSRLPLIRKPFCLAELLEKVANVVDGPVPFLPDMMPGGHIFGR